MATAALSGGELALAEFVLEVGRPVQPMLASSAPTVAEAMQRIDRAKIGGEVAVDTRSLDDITVRLPEVVEIVRALPATHAVLDGEVLAIGPDGRPRPFQETASRTAQSTGLSSRHSSSICCTSTAAIWSTPPAPSATQRCSRSCRRPTWSADW